MTLTPDHAQELVKETVRLAQHAAESGTFGVGGMLVDKQGNILFQVENDVMRDGKLHDPTAHAERQIIDWYYQQGDTLPPPQELTLITSLEPCMMCTGCILESGFNVAVVAPDTFNGVFQGNAESTVATLPPELMAQIKDQMFFLKFTDMFGQEFSMPAAANDNWRTLEFPKTLADQALDTFIGSLDDVKTVINTDVPFADLRDPALAPGEIRDSLQKLMQPYYADTLTHRLTPETAATELPILLAATGADNPAALVDPFGNVLLIVTGKEELSPIRTSIMEVVRAWSAIREAAGPELQPYLPHPKHCQFVTLHGPARDAKGVIQLAVHGSMMEGPYPAGNHPFAYIHPSQEKADLTLMANTLPEFYRSINVAPEPYAEVVQIARQETKAQAASATQNRAAL